jgi:uncharacterized membrane protein
MLRPFYALLIGIVGAGIVHIAVLLLLPQFSERDAWSSLAEAADFYKAVRIDGGDGGTAVVRSVDPLFHAAACRFDLDEGPVHLSAPGNVPFWSVSIYNRAGQNIYSFNDRATERGALDFVILTNAQMIEVRKAVPEEAWWWYAASCRIRPGKPPPRSFWLNSAAPRNSRPASESMFQT